MVKQASSVHRAGKRGAPHLHMPFPAKRIGQGNSRIGTVPVFSIDNYGAHVTHKRPSVKVIKSTHVGHRAAGKSKAQKRST